MKDILPYLKPYRRRIALAMLLVAAATVCDLLLPTIMNDILNHGVRQSDFAYIVRCCAWMLAVAAAGLAALLAGRKISCDVVAGFNADLRTDVFSLVNNMTFEEFNAIGAAALLSRSTYDIGTVSWVASMISGSLITIPVLFFGGVILSLRKDVMMSLILLLFVPAIFLIVRPISKRIGPLHETSSNAFSPNANTTRGMIVTILARVEGVNTSGTPWYAAGQKWAMDNGISDGTNMVGEVTREQLATILYRYAKQKGYDVSKSAALTAFADADKVSGYASEAMQWAVAEGLLQGSNGKLDPQGSATRAQVATILMRFMEKIAK